jgi:signal transduction histidine kinase/ligand-binding sensor domain-containing protein
VTAGPSWAIFEDSRGDIWVGTGGTDTHDGGLNRFDPETRTFRRFQHDPEDSNSLSQNSVAAINEDLAGNLWIGTLGGGLNRFNRDTGDFVSFRNDPDDDRSLSHDDVWAIHVDTKGVVRVGVGDIFGRDESGGLNEFEPATGTFKRYIHDPSDPKSVSGPTVTAIHEDPSGALWIGTITGGLNYFDPKTQVFTQIGGSASTLSLMEDRSGVLWNGTWDKGARALDRLANRFVHYGHEPGNPNSIAIGDVMAVREVPAGSDLLWVGTWGGGLTRINRTTGDIKRYRHDPNNRRSIADPLVRTIYETRDGTMWVGTWGGLDRYDRATDSFTAFEPNSDDSTSISHQAVRVILEDRSGMMWVGTWGGGLNRFDRTTGRFTSWLMEPDTESPGDNQVGVVFEDLRNRLWVGSNNGGLYLFDRAEEAFVKSFFTDSTETSAINDIVDGSAGRLWVAGYFGVIDFDPETGDYTSYTDADGLGHQQVKGLLRDKAGRLWASTNNGVSRFDASTKTWRNYNTADGLSQSKFESRSFYESPTGEFYLGGAEGVEAFFPDQIQDDPRPPKVAITEIRLFGTPLEPGEDSPLKQSVVETSNLTFDYNQNEVGFAFAGLHFVRPEQNQYKYKLEPYDKDWSVPSTQRTAHYTNLDPGDYTFSVMAANNDGVWSEEAATIGLKITPPFWGTWWFRLVGLLAIAGVIGLGFNWRTRQLAERSRRLEELVTQRTEELADRNTQLEQSHTVVQAINKETSFRRLLTKILEEARVIPGVEKATAIVYMPEEGVFRVRASSGWDVTSMEHIRLTPVEASARYVDRSKELAPDIFVAKNVRELAGAQQMKEFGNVASFLVLRVNVESQIAGYLVFDNLSDSDAFDDKDVALLERLKEHIQSAFIKTRLLEGLRNQNDQISAQRAELQRTLDSLRATQDRLVQSEKMASLGQLTAGIAHEIKNPLNFVNNFSEMSVELTDELVEELEARKDHLPKDFVDELDGILRGLKINAQKISEHGKRADSIVQSMLQHSRGGEGERQEVNINELLDEYVNLAYHGARARESDFNATINKDYEEGLGPVELIPQDIGRVFLNLLGNAFDALRMLGVGGRESAVGPAVSVATRQNGAHVEIRISDNGPGIPDHVKSRIFEPFFTTKPTGSGTGLGLSMSYDIVTKGHGGELDVVSEPGEGATFIVRLPV